MRRGTLLALVLVVAGLLVLWRAKERELAHGGPALEQYPLFPGFASGRIASLRIDNLERSIQVELERDASGRWFLTDPLAYPAQDSLVRSLLQTLELALGEPAGEVEARSVALDPPKVVLECEQVEPGGKRTLRIELGALALDPSQIFVRVPEHPGRAQGGAGIFRTLRTLATTLERDPDDYRDRRATPLLAQQVTSFRRRGVVFLQEEGQPVELSFDALLEPDGWKQVAPVRVSLDPSGILLLARGAAELEVERFADDSPGSLVPYGLDPPAFTVELEDERGSPTTLRFGHAGGEDERPLEEYTWYCQREGFPHVWQAKSRDVGLLTRPARLVYDYDVVRSLRQDVARLELEGAGRQLVLERIKEGWTVRERLPDGAAGLEPPRHPASPGAVEDALALLERTQLGDFLPGVGFAEEEPPLSFALVTSSGARLGGRLGQPWRDETSGAQGRLYLRDGDELVGLIAEEVAGLCQKPLDELRAKQLHQIQESQVRWITLEHAGRSFTFVNSGDNVWKPKDQAIGAPADFLQALDALLNLSARRWLEPGAVPALADQLDILVQPVSADELRLALGHGPGGSALCRSASGELAEIDGALLERLLGLF